MKRVLITLVVCGIAGVAFALNVPKPSSPASNAKPQAEKLIVHEWGTFTGFAGSDGVHLPFGIDAGAGLPPFVLTRLEQAKRQNVKVDHFREIFSKGEGFTALQRMETPVIYFYTERQRDVSVRVDFPQGQLSEFYPPVRTMLPAYGDGPGEYYRVERPQNAKPPAAKPARFENGSLDWGTVTLIPRVCCDTDYSSFPKVPKSSGLAEHYQYARDTDSATVRFSDRPNERHDERFLFYRGLGDFTLPVTLRALGEERFEMSNSSAQPVRFALLLQISDARARFAVFNDITSKREMTLPAESVSIDVVGDAITQALVAEGLYEKEAKAMVKTWSSNWLGEPGTRILYTVPRQTTDALLPLHMSPTPDETVRVLVGRIDVMTPELEQHIASMMPSADFKKPMPLEDVAMLRDLGRFFDPALRRAGNLVGEKDRDLKQNRLRWMYYNSSKS